jgi:hypothetical protein
VSNAYYLVQVISNVSPLNGTAMVVENKMLLFDNKVLLLEYTIQQNLQTLKRCEYIYEGLIVNSNSNVTQQQSQCCSFVINNVI